MFSCVFADVDGTLLNSRHEVTPDTRNAILTLQAKGIPFVIASGRSPSGIYPLMQKAGINCPIIAYNGTLIQDENRKILFSCGFSIAEAADIIHFIEDNQLDLAWCAYCADEWFTADRSDPRIINEESIVESVSIEARVESLPAGTVINKILCICAPDKLNSIERIMKSAYPHLSIFKSSDILLEVMIGNTNKAVAVKHLCKLWDISPANTIAFGDSYNDIEMLESVGLGVIMGNAPVELLNHFANHTRDNDHDGIARNLERTGLIP